MVFKLLVKIKRKTKLPLAVKKQPLSSQTEAESWASALKLKVSCEWACLEGRACEKEGSGDTISAQREKSQAKAHILLESLPTKEEEAEKYKWTGAGAARELKAVVSIGSKRLQERAADFLSQSRRESRAKS